MKLSDYTVTKSGVSSVDGLIQGNWSWTWQSSSVTSNTLYYDFVTTNLSSTSETEIAMSSSQQAAVKSVLEQVTSITGINFVQTWDDSKADIHYADAQLDSGTAGLEYTAKSWKTSSNGTVTSMTADSYVWLDTSYTDTSVGSYGYQVLLHETGHAMGLAHPFESTSYPSSQDTWDYSVMSYTRGSTGIQTSYQENDVATLHWLYGTDGLGGDSYKSTSTTTTTTTTTTTSSGTMTEHEKEVLYLYDTLGLGTPDIATYDSQASKLDSGTSLSTLATSLISSNHISTNPASFLSSLFKNVYDRTPTTSEKRTLRSTYAGKTPGQVAATMATCSDEATAMAGTLSSLSGKGYAMTELEWQGVGAGSDDYALPLITV
jgi:hypothetical protein